MSAAKKINLEPAGSTLGDSNTSEEYTAAIAAMEQEREALVKQAKALEDEQDAALFGQGNLHEVNNRRQAMAAQIMTLEKRIAGATRRMEDAIARETLADIEGYGKRAASLGGDLKDVYRQFFEHIEAARQALFRADEISRDLGMINMRLESAGRRNLTVNIETCRSQGMGEPVRPPQDIRTRFRAVDRSLTALYSAGGPLNGRLRNENPKNRPGQRFPGPTH
ncbi:hypothetical protein REJC140_03856 [Pseudorhizobium endolithicum]|uniref:Uncharacterized protein n=1 Tax=Pseudorhizobium endolithicum TaxID=1191678 RepID=A0ABM8PRP2_9HYPH|nr:hypothetical protein [Pseudorhizobium endolithicum]CAD7044708.1 hypothetical protein REJC140_03856 [Pseudorhizobium endolithicum]